jgi:hypothetical protein
MIFDISEDDSYQEKKRHDDEPKPQTAKDFGKEVKTADWADSELFKFI